jgi:hypothetical protein
MSSSVRLTARQQAGLNKIGDIYFPGEGACPSFSKLGCVEHVGFALGHLPEDDRQSLQLLLGVVGTLPKAFARLLIWLGEFGPRTPGPLGVGLRFLRLGLKGIVTSLYYSGERGAGYQGPTPLDILDYRVSVYTLDKSADEGGSVAACRDLTPPSP